LSGNFRFCYTAADYMIFNIPKLLQFLDDPDTQAKGGSEILTSNRGHASSIIGLIGEDLNAAVFKYYSSNEVEILTDKLTQGGRRGKWLDRWIADHDKKILYQCEIKNWAGASLGGRTVPLDASPELQKEVAEYNLNKILADFTPEREHPTGLTKVLLPMQAPQGFESYAVRPMLILWMLMTNDISHMNPYFRIKTQAISETFSEIDVFSVSLYLRQLLAQNITSIELDTPHIDERMRLLRGFLNVNN